MKNPQISAIVVLASLSLLLGFRPLKVEAQNAVAPATPQVSFLIGKASELALLVPLPVPPNGATTAGLIQQYVNQTIERDGFANQVQAKVWQQDDGIFIGLNGPNAVTKQYAGKLAQFFKNGRLAIQARKKVADEGHWMDNWRLFLPVGLSMLSSKSLQLLHFPPDTMINERDYLGSATSKRWEGLLTAQGIKLGDVSLYESIVDLVPIAAPDGDGDKMSTTYKAFTPYTKSMLELLAAHKSSAVAYGSPAREWIRSVYHVTIPLMHFADLPLSGGKKVTVLAANHPASIWKASDPGERTRIMLQDITAACWQFRMLQSGAKPKHVLDTCNTHWSKQPHAICVLVELSYDKTPDEAEQHCAKPAANTLSPANKLTASQAESFALRD